ncbi:MAG: glutamate-5-semialdehyde dehydrogenase [Ramalina farinacea]|uniref:glutamate-5-semialdehyde dehydrogenase n=1 Tax=Ramalina farinacea TaxID=258253 RepID=A0AA43TVZ2_9LECA|nr:glutamate-5-semialdehyde dehydrogenase [Ramalina farinacea]
MSVTDSSPLEIAKAASISSRSLAILPTEARNDALTAVHAALSSERSNILAANAEDLRLAAKAAEEGELSQSVLKRLDLGRQGKYEDMLKGILDVRALEDPINKVSLRTKLDDGLELERVTCPIGVLLIIFEARPEVIANIASLAIKSGNAAILKGGKETTLSFLSIARVISTALSNTSVPNAAIQLVTARSAIASLLTQDQHIDLCIPRGSNELVRYIKNNTRIPVLGHADGLCNIYIHSDADVDMAVKILLDAKLGYPAACNAVETLLIDESALSSVGAKIADALLQRGVSLRCDALSKAILARTLDAGKAAILQDAAETDFSTEFLAPILAIKTIPTPSTATSPTEAAYVSTSLAIAHINAHSSHHTDAIITANPVMAKQFQAGVDSACVFWNTSTRMADGMRFGFGTEVGISTNKIHARGPVGLEGIVIYKYLISGQGQVAGEYYEGEGGRKWKHERMEI